MTATKKKELVFTRFQRFWHWLQALLIIALLVTGFEVNGAFPLMGYQESAHWHRFFAWCLIWLWVFALFWHLVTGEWRQYMPTSEKMFAVIRYYSVGIFKPHVRHPYRRSLRFKHNPLQRLAYLLLHLVVTPIIWVSGLAYMYYNNLPGFGLDWATLGLIAGVHVAVAFAMLNFLILHVYLAFSGSNPTAYLKPMITGYWEVDPGMDQNRECRLLVIEDDEDYFNLVHNWLLSAAKNRDGEALFVSANPTIRHVRSMKDAFRQLRRSDFDVILTDLNLPDSEGLETFSRLSAHFGTIPTVVITGSDHENQGIQAVRMGAQDYLVKGRTDREKLAKAIRYARARHVHSHD